MENEQNQLPKISEVYELFNKELDGRELTEREKKIGECLNEKILKPAKKELPEYANLTMEVLLTNLEVKEKAFDVIKNSLTKKEQTLFEEDVERSRKSRDAIKKVGRDKVNEFLSAKDCTALRALEILNVLVEGKTGVEKIEAARAVWMWLVTIGDHKASKAKAVREEWDRITLEVLREEAKKKTGIEKIKAVKVICEMRVGAGEVVEKERRKIFMAAYREEMGIVLKDFSEEEKEITLEDLEEARKKTVEYLKEKRKRHASFQEKEEIAPRVLRGAEGEPKGLACVAGMKDLKKLLIDEVIKPLKNPEKFRKFKVSIPHGILLYGPPGCGKTFIVRKLAEELGYNFFDIKHSDLATPYIHGSVGNIAKVFDVAKQNAPAIVFFDEISGLVPDRRDSSTAGSYKEEEVNEFLMQLNDANSNNILVVGATNYIDRIDPAVLRPGRMDKKIYVPPPDYEARKELFKLGLADRLYDKNIDFNRLAELTAGHSCADIINGIVESAARIAANLDKLCIDQELLESEIKKAKPAKEKTPAVMGFRAS